MTEDKPKKKRKYTDADRARNQRYKDKNTVVCSLRLNKNTEPELIEIFNSLPNKRQFFRDALRRYAEENNIKTEDNS